MLQYLVPFFTCIVHNNILVDFKESVFNSFRLYGADELRGSIRQLSGVEIDSIGIGDEVSATC